LFFGQAAVVEQVLGMGHHGVRSKAAIAVDAQGTWAVAQVLVARRAQAAFAATNPGEDHATVADLHADGVWAHGHHRTGDLMAQGPRRLDGAGHVQLHIVAEVKVAVVQVHVAVAHATAAHAHHHFGALGGGNVAQHLR